jgi:hypothetical protein
MQYYKEDMQFWFSKIAYSKNKREFNNAVLQYETNWERLTKEQRESFDDTFLQTVQRVSDEKNVRFAPKKRGTYI